jgi:hypothetical protein
MLNEVDHGCDAKNLETTATLQSVLSSTVLRLEQQSKLKP